MQTLERIGESFPEKHGMKYCMSIEFFTHMMSSNANYRLLGRGDCFLEPDDIKIINIEYLPGRQLLNLWVVPSSGNEEKFYPVNEAHEWFEGAMLDINKERVI